MSELLEIPRSSQTDDYSCGAHCVKMVADFYKILNKKTKNPYTITGIKRMCNTTKEGGTEIKDLDRGLKKLGLKRVRTSIAKMIGKQSFRYPVIALIKDDTPNTDHYVLIDGAIDGMLSIVDPESHVTTYIGSTRIEEELCRYAGKFWLWEVHKA